MRLIAHLYPAPRLNKRGAILLLLLHAFMACAGHTLPFFVSLPVVGSRMPIYMYQNILIILQYKISKRRGGKRKNGNYIIIRFGREAFRAADEISD